MSGGGRRGVGTARPTSWTERSNGNRALEAAQVDAIIRRHQAGVGATEIAREFGISRRTVYRWVRACVLPVEAGGWRALFAIRDADSQVREGPVQLSPVAAHRGRTMRHPA